MSRMDGRAFGDCGPSQFETDFVKFARGVLRHPLRQHQVLCCASVEEQPPPCARGHGLGDGGVLHAAPGQPGAVQAGTSPS